MIATGRELLPSRVRGVAGTSALSDDARALLLVFAATAVGTIPLILVFIVFGRQIIGGIMEGAVKA